MAENPTIGVYVATTVDDPRFFANWPLDRLDEVIPLLARWGLTDSDGDDTDPGSNAVGEFVHTGSMVMFRVSVIGES